MFLFSSVFDVIERYAPGFKDSVIGRDILTPPDLEKTFGLTGGVSLSFFHHLLLPFFSPHVFMLNDDVWTVIVICDVFF